MTPGIKLRRVASASVNARRCGAKIILNPNLSCPTRAKTAARPSRFEPMSQEEVASATTSGCRRDLRRPSLRFLTAALVALAGDGGVVRPSAASGRVRWPRW
jgi:hypothetical protein